MTFVLGGNPEEDSQFYYHEWQTTMEELTTLQKAVRKHRDQRGDDRCWQDDIELYQALPEGCDAPKRDCKVELENCRKYIESRSNPGTEYISPQRRIEELENEVDLLKLAIKMHSTYCDMALVAASNWEESYEQLLKRK